MLSIIHYLSCLCLTCALLIREEDEHEIIKTTSEPPWLNQALCLVTAMTKWSLYSCIITCIFGIYLNVTATNWVSLRIATLYFGIGNICHIISNSFSIHIQIWAPIHPAPIHGHLAYSLATQLPKAILLLTLPVALFFMVRRKGDQGPTATVVSMSHQM